MSSSKRKASRHDERSSRKRHAAETPGAPDEPRDAAASPQPETPPPRAPSEDTAVQQQQQGQQQEQQRAESPVRERHAPQADETRYCSECLSCGSVIGNVHDSLVRQKRGDGYMCDACQRQGRLLRVCAMPACEYELVQSGQTACAECYSHLFETLEEDKRCAWPKCAIKKACHDPLACVLCGVALEDAPASAGLARDYGAAGVCGSCIRSRVLLLKCHFCGESLATKESAVCGICVDAARQ